MLSVGSPQPNYVEKTNLTNWILSVVFFFPLSIFKYLEYITTCSRLFSFFFNQSLGQKTIGHFIKRKKRNIYFIAYQSSPLAFGCVTLTEVFVI